MTTSALLDLQFVLEHDPDIQIADALNQLILERWDGSGVPAWHLLEEVMGKDFVSKAQGIWMSELGDYYGPDGKVVGTGVIPKHRDADGDPWPSRNAFAHAIEERVKYEAERGNELFGLQAQAIDLLRDVRGQMEPDESIHDPWTYRPAEESALRRVFIAVRAPGDNKPTDAVIDTAQGMLIDELGPAASGGLNYLAENNRELFRRVVSTGIDNALERAGLPPPEAVDGGIY